MAWVYDDFFQAYRNTDTGTFATAADAGSVQTAIAQQRGSPAGQLDLSGWQFGPQSQGNNQQIYAYNSKTGQLEKAYGFSGGFQAGSEHGLPQYIPESMLPQAQDLYKGQSVSSISGDPTGAGTSIGLDQWSLANTGAGDNWFGQIMQYAPLAAMAAFGGITAGAAAGGGAAASGAGAAGGSSMMPAAQALSAAELGGMGLVQTAPGVWAAPGAAGYVGASGTGLSALAGGAEVGSYTAPSVETGAWPNAPQTPTAPTPPTPIQNVTPMSGAGGGGGVATPVAGGGSNISNLAPAGGPSGGPPVGGAAQGIGVADSLKLGMGLYGLHQASQLQDDIEGVMNQNQTFPYENYYGKVDQYLNDPMSVLRNNPGYLASIDFVEKEARRKMAQGGYNVSGNATHYMADALGKNAAKWYEQAWAPIRDAAGVNYDPSRMTQAQTNAYQTINQTKQNAIGSFGKAAGDTLPSIFKFALG